MNKRSLTKLVSVMLVAVLAIAAVPFTASAAATATQITSASELVTGEYVIVTTTNFALSTYDASSWVLSKAVTPASGKITEITPDMVWNVTVSGNSVKLTDSNGVTIAPKGGNNNGIKTGDYSWDVSFEGGVFKFAGVGADTVFLAANKNSDSKFRAYKSSTVTGTNASSYCIEFNLFKVTGEAEEAPIEYISVKEARDAETGAECYIEALISFIDGKNIYLYDNTASIVAYLAEANSEIKVGDIIKVSGRRGSYNGLEQLGSASVVEIVSSNNEVEYKETTIADILADQQVGNIEAAPVIIKNVTIGEINTSGNTPVTEGENSINVYKIPALEGIEAGDVVDIKAVVGDYNGYQLRVADADDITLAQNQQPEGDEDEDEPENEDDNEASNPETGDATVVFVMCVVVSALAVAVISKKRYGAN